jgi:hypothetical protein
VTSDTLSCSISQTGYRPCVYKPPDEFTNVDIVTHDHAFLRAK